MRYNFFLTLTFICAAVLLSGCLRPPNSSINREEGNFARKNELKTEINAFHHKGNGKNLSAENGQKLESWLMARDMAGLDHIKIVVSNIHSLNHVKAVFDLLPAVSEIPVIFVTQSQNVAGSSKSVLVILTRSAFTQKSCYDRAGKYQLGCAINANLSASQIHSTTSAFGRVEISDFGEIHLQAIGNITKRSQKGPMSAQTSNSNGTGAGK
jgi:hypothetical protein